MEFEKRQLVSVGEPISATGIKMIESLLGFRLPEDFDWTEVTERGRITRRISQYAKEQRSIKLSKPHIEAVGNLYQKYIIKPQEVWCDLTKKFAWKAGDFADRDSCYWASKSLARKMIEGENGFAVRYYQRTIFAETFSPERSLTGKGRAWVLPTSDGYAVFNAYGAELDFFASIVQKLTEKRFRTSVRLTNNGKTNGLLWINQGRAIFVADKSLESFPEVELGISGSSWLYKVGLETGEYVIRYCDACSAHTWHETNGTCTGEPADRHGEEIRIEEEVE